MDRIQAVSSNYESTLTVDIGYQYSESFRKDIIVRKSEGTAFENQQTTDPLNCFSWQTLDSNQERCVNTCDFKAVYDREYPGFSEMRKVMNLQTANEVDGDYLWNHTTCSYQGSAHCKDNPELCVLENDLCPPGTFCGIPECLLRNTPPTITNRKLIGSNELQFTCTDSDDTMNIKQTCGCINQIYYDFVNKSKSCNSETFNQTSTGVRNTLLGVQHTITGVGAEENRDKRLCILVKDKLNANRTLSLTYPFG